MCLETTHQVLYNITIDVPTLRFEQAAQLYQRLLDMWEAINDKLAESLHPAVYTVVILLIQLFAQIFYGGREFIKGNTHLNYCENTSNS